MIQHPRTSVLDLPQATNDLPDVRLFNYNNENFSGALGHGHSKFDVLKFPSMLLSQNQCHFEVEIAHLMFGANQHHNLHSFFWFDHGPTTLDIH